MRGGKEHARSTQPIVQDEGSVPTASGSGSGVMLQLLSSYFLFPLFLHPPIHFPYLHRWNPLSLYLSFPSELSDTHAFLSLLAQPCASLLFNKHSLKAMHFFTIKHFQVGYLLPSLDLNVL